MANLKHKKGKVLIMVDIESKNSHRFADGTEIRLERGVDNFNQREVMPVNAIVVSSSIMPSGAEVLVHHNSAHRVNEIFDHDNEVGEFSTIKYYSIPEQDCYLWRENKGGNWVPCKGFATALRIFKPHNGIILGVESKLVENVLWVTSGEFKHKVAHVLKASDYELVFQGDNGQEQRIVRFRHFENEENEREEVLAIDDFLTQQVLKGELLIGLTKDDCCKFAEND